MEFDMSKFTRFALGTALFGISLALPALPTMANEAC